MFLIWIVLIIVIIWILKDKLNFNIKKDDPLYILKKRYVNGEISREEFEKMKTELK